MWVRIIFSSEVAAQVQIWDNVSMLHMGLSIDMLGGAHRIAILGKQWPFPDPIVADLNSGMRNNCGQLKLN